ncbi:hypothetical protein KR059_009909, partial [Drosophila kikkawai]
GYEPNGLKLWDLDNEKFIVARDVIVDETNMINSRAVKSGLEFLNESKEKSKECDNVNILNESKECDNVNILNESKECDNVNILNESKECDNINILNESKECDNVNIPNESKDNDTVCNLNESKEKDNMKILNESKENNKINFQNDSMEKRFDSKQLSENIECISRRSDRLKNRQQISYKEDE